MAKNKAIRQHQLSAVEMYKLPAGKAASINKSKQAANRLYSARQSNPDIPADIREHNEEIDRQRHARQLAKKQIKLRAKVI